MRTCCACGQTFDATGNNYRCAPCRSAYEKQWRANRKAAGNPVIPTPMPREYHRAYEANYFAAQENRERRNAHMRRYRLGALRPHHEARQQVRRAIVAGKLTKQPCEICGATKVHAHHDDYAQPLAVRWLCLPHHTEIHAKAEGR